MSNSVWPHRQQPSGLRHPWDSPGENTGVGCHCLLQCVKVKSESEVVQSCLTLRDPMDCSLPGSSIHGIFQARVLEWGAKIAHISEVNLNNFFDSTYKCIMIFVFLWLHLVLSSPGPSMLLQVAWFHSLFVAKVCHCIHVTHFLYPFLCRWTFELLPCLGYCK